MVGAIQQYKMEKGSDTDDSHVLSKADDNSASSINTTDDKCGNLMEKESNTVCPDEDVAEVIKINEETDNNAACDSSSDAEKPIALHVEASQTNMAESVKENTSNKDAVNPGNLDQPDERVDDTNFELPDQNAVSIEEQSAEKLEQETMEEAEQPNKIDGNDHAENEINLPVEDALRQLVEEAVKQSDKVVEQVEEAFDQHNGGKEQLSKETQPTAENIVEESTERLVGSAKQVSSSPVKEASKQPKQTPENRKSSQQKQSTGKNKPKVSGFVNVYDIIMSMELFLINTYRAGLHKIRT